MELKGKKVKVFRDFQRKDHAFDATFVEFTRDEDGIPSAIIILDCGNVEVVNAAKITFTGKV